MKIQLKLLAIASFLLFYLNAQSEQNTICTTPAIKEAIQAQYTGDKEITDIWEKLENETIVKIKNSDAKARPSMVNIQALVESSIASLLKTGDIKYSKAVIYAPIPSTPLRANTFNIDTLVRKDFFKDTNRVATITIRQNSLQKYLTNGGTIYNVYKAIEPEKENNIPGINVYKDNLKKYQNTLVNKPADSINTRYTGASYIAECKDGKKVFFAIKGRQANDTRKKQWVLYYGELIKSNKKLDRYFKRVQSLYEEADVSFNFQ